MKNLILFDIDNTLVKKSTLHAKTIEVALQNITGKNINLSDIKSNAGLSFHGNTDRKILIDILSFIGFSADEQIILRCIEQITRYYSDNIHLETAVAIEGAAAALNTLKSSHRLGLVTGNIEGVAWNKLRSVSLDGYFSKGGFGSDHHERSELVKIAIERNSRECNCDYTGHTFVVGDTPRDIDASKKAQTHSIGVATGFFTEDDLIKSGADIVIQNYSESERLFSFIDLHSSC